MPSERFRFRGGMAIAALERETGRRIREKSLGERALPSSTFRVRSIQLWGVVGADLRALMY